MKKTFSIIATALAFLLAFTSCEKDEKTELVDPMGGNHEVETEIHAVISGAYTKALAFKIAYSDFEGNKDTVMVNPKFDGENSTFETKFKTKTRDDVQEASVHIQTILAADVNSYMSEESPWTIEFSVITRLDGNILDNFHLDDNETNTGLQIFNPEYIVLGNCAANTYKDFTHMFGPNGDQNFVISTSKKETNCKLQ